MEQLVYPIKFKPILKEKVWGGTKLKTLLGKKTTSNIVGESWEVSGVENNVSRVENGSFKGKSVMELISLYKEEFLGKKVYRQFGNQFPLLFKFIDAKEDLSVQLHPGDALAKERHNSFGKTEMWYIVQADENASLIIGFNQKVNKESYLEYLNAQTLEKILNREPVKKGDVFYIPPGLIHAIGAGTLLAEIQQTSDITYRIYDWNRLDTNGKMRELHHDLALDAIAYESDITYKVPPPNHASEQLLTAPYFSVKQVQLGAQNKTRSLSDIDSFVVYMCVEGETVISVNDKTEHLGMGDTVLIPACANTVCFQKGPAKLLEVFVP